MTDTALAHAPADPTTSTPLTPSDVAGLRAVVAGPVLLPGQQGYPEETTAFNLALIPTPAVVVGVTSTADVVAAVNFARRHHRRVSVQATGHGLADTLDGTVMVSTRRLTGVQIDPQAKTATVAAGEPWRSVIDAAAVHGLAPLAGSSSNVGAVGYTLGGGTGLLSRRWGFAADHLTSLTIVTGDGQLRVVDADHEPDLFWAVRGGKVGFGIAVEMTIDLFDVPRFYGGGLFFPGPSANDVIRAWRTWAETLPPQVSTSVAMLRLPPDPQLPPPLQGAFVTHLRYADLGGAEEAEARLAALRGVAPILFDTIGELPFTAADAVHLDPATPMPTFSTGVTLSQLPDEAIDALTRSNDEDSGSGLALVEVRLMGGALHNEPAVANAVPGRRAAYALYALGVPTAPDDTVTAEQVASVITAVAPWKEGALPNFVGDDASPWSAMWSPTTRARLARIARHYDPDNTLGGSDAFRTE